MGETTEADFAVGNLDGDPEPEIIAQYADDYTGVMRLMMFDHAGSFKK